MTSTQSLRSVCLRRTKQLLGLKIPKKEEVKRMLLCFFSVRDILVAVHVSGFTE
jgi:hypothetical protein